jgi:hypothetical protein
MTQNIEHLNNHLEQLKSLHNKQVEALNLVIAQQQAKIQELEQVIFGMKSAGF